MSLIPTGAPYISAIERLSTEDGPGLRTVVFFKGCPLRCIWCHNPETLHPALSILFHPDRCIGCGSCASVCANDAIHHDKNTRINRNQCHQCGACSTICVTNAIEVSGVQYPTDVLVNLLLEDKPYFENSGGGVTFSGGEPLLHMHYLKPVCIALHKQGIPIAIQTAGAFRFSEFETILLPHVDLIYFDIKLMDTIQHRTLTGLDNRLILENFEKLCKCAPHKTIPRTPLIPGLTDTPENLNAIQTFIHKLSHQHGLQHGISQWHRLTFNPGYAAKWEAVGLKPEIIERD
ncbi:MAG: glycyl-radical enzyme activating protein [Deltaproteobacteria bacterium]|nr:glycyl-radical enzyme activating protein [Deltaproteobacteria bacterium]